MSLVKLPFSGNPYQNVDETVITDGTAKLIDAYMDESGATIKRPGLSSFSTVVSGASRVNGIFWWETKSKLAVIVDGRVFSVTSAGVATELTGATLNSTARVSFADNGTYLVLANGGRMVYWDGSSATIGYVDAVASDAPTDVEKVAFLDNYIIASRAGTGVVEFSDGAVGTESPITWNGDYFTAESKPDGANGVFASWRELLVTGPKSCEVWYDDGESPFARIEGAYTERGVMAPDSVVSAGGVWYFLDSLKRFSVLDGRSPKPISTPFDKVIHNLKIVSDCIGDVIEVDGKAFIVWTFPTENRTLVFNYQLNIWQEWGEFSRATGLYNRFRANCHVYIPAWGKHLVGDYASGTVFEMSSTNFDDNGNAIRALRRTGHADFGTYRNKIIREVIFRVKCGVGNSTVTDPTMGFRFKKNNDADWSNDRLVPLRQIGNTEFIGRVFNLGQARTWQFEAWQSDACEWVLVDAMADVEEGLS